MFFFFGRRNIPSKTLPRSLGYVFGRERSRSLTTGSGCLFFFHRARSRVMILPMVAPLNLREFWGTYVAISSVNWRDKHEPPREWKTSRVGYIGVSVRDKSGVDPLCALQSDGFQHYCRRLITQDGCFRSPRAPCPVSVVSK